jgi:hypothetical protein
MAETMIEALKRKGRKKSGGPWHPPEGVKTKCTRADSCGAIMGKMAVLQRFSVE